MKSIYIRNLMVLFSYFISSLAVADGVDVFKTTQSSNKENFEIICTSSFEAPYDDLYAYESVWNWTLFGGYFSWVPVKVGEKYTGDFRYVGMSCSANRITPENTTVEVSFDFDINGQVAITSSNVPLDVSIEDYTNTYETAKLIFTISKLAYDINESGLVASVISRFSVAAIQEAAVFAVIAHLASDSVFIYIEQNEIKQQISNFMNNEAADTTKNVTTKILTDVISLEETYQYSLVMPAINHIILNSKG